MNLRAYSFPIWALTMIFWLGLNVNALAQSNHLAVSGLGNSFPSYTFTGDEFTLAIEVRNLDQNQSWSQPIDILYQVDNGPTLVMAQNFQPINPVLPGASTTIIIEDFTLEEASILGGGGGGAINHTIIVWPMRPGLGQSDEDEFSFSFEFLPDWVARTLTISNPSIPGTINPTQSVDVAFTVTNADPNLILHHDIEIWYSIDGGPGQLMGTHELEEVVLPGGEVVVELSDVTLNVGGGGGGGLNHTIIVWPMAFAVEQFGNVIHNFTVENPGKRNGILPSTWFNPVSNQLAQIIQSGGSNPSLEISPALERTASVRVFDLQGKVLLNTKASANDRIELDQLPTGLYIYQVSLDEIQSQAIFSVRK
ncbi:T9SS type A sorting domain-containing protein [Pontibacter sp. G13]|uniref:T9SS type A sorting domain-containing protein n=1 Tax=Pontibacter sp. G13 TaxID=3074898 RepID=UPI00288A053B|nr:T9SS type A sorting domain-containing protein [Pontibacter sp. G13]WNJ17854.1 T9SS type A sorting domain-containing protein [Pontibacter sp. G13]